MATSPEMPDNRTETAVPARRRPKTDAELERVAEVLAKGGTIKEALKAGGYSDNVARQGSNALSARAMAKITKHGVKLSLLGSRMTAEEQENIVRGRLLWNVTLGKDLGTKSAELLGRDKRVNMFAADQMTGVIVLQMPSAIGEQTVQRSLPVLDGEVTEPEEPTK